MKRRLVVVATAAFSLAALAPLMPAVAVPIGWNGFGYQTGLYGVGGATTPLTSTPPYTLSTSPTPFTFSSVRFKLDDPLTFEEVDYLGVTYTDLGVPGGQLPSLAVLLVGGKCSQIQNVLSGVNLLTGPFNNALLCGTGGGTTDSYATTIATLGSYEISGFSFVLGGGLPPTAQTLVLSSIDVGLAVPEPGSLALFVSALGLFGLFGIYRRRRPLLARLMK
ncbi:MAG: PEP-CTERM sorting domain-containing protein [bacterium]|nr:PEP-CTERM sorting domain-containing protein [bacterium]